MVNMPEQKVRFDELAELFHTFAADSAGIFQPWVLANVPDLSTVDGARAVDLGCGTGRFTGLLADRHAEVLGVDISAREIDIARAEHRRPGVRLEVRSLLDVTPGTDGVFDTVFTVTTLHHLRAYDVALPHLRSLVAPGGHLAIIDLVDPGPWRDRDWHVQRAFEDAEDSYRNRSRSAEVAADVLRLRLHPTWLEHAAANVPLPRAEFADRYRAAFPGATFTDLHDDITAIHWRAPA
ncbi:MAG TPA: class I SAM-dependent methyltransferase [Mycobacteriales bacterium]|nr:class I SAM-dependent methyltransferase [Mycobacteriales bacterium]